MDYIAVCRSSTVWAPLKVVAVRTTAIDALKAALSLGYTSGYVTDRDGEMQWFDEQGWIKDDGEEMI